MDEREPIVRTDRGMVVKRLMVRNFKGAVRVDIHAPDTVVEVAGKNGAGKSSVLDAIVAALAGARGIDAEPLTHGATKGEIELDLGDLVCTRRFNEDNQTRGGTLKVTAKDGSKWKQRELNGIFGDFSFDPLAFSRQQPTEQVTMLQRLAGVEFCKVLDALDGAIELGKTNRADVNRDLKRFGQVPDLEPVEPVDVQQLLQDIGDANEHNAEQQNRQREIDDHARRMEGIERRVTELRQLLSDAEAQLKELEFASLPRVEDPILVGPLQEKLTQAMNINAKFEEYQRAEKARAEWQQLNARSLQLDREIEDLREKRRQHARSAQLPVDGLAWGQDGIVLNGVPFAQLSSSEQLRLSARIGIAQAPALRVMLIHDGSLLDDDAFAELRTLAQEHGHQLWIESVGTGHTADALVITDGELDNEEAF